MEFIDNKRIANGIKQYRKKFNYSQSELSKMINVSRSTLSYIEQGKRELTASELLNICAIFNINVWQLINYERAIRDSYQVTEFSKQFIRLSKEMNTLKRMIRDLLK